jgi:hypothetical protein
MARQIVTVSAGGVISGLQVKPGKGFDLARSGLARAAIVRASEIEWSDMWQAWTVRLQTTRHAGQNVSGTMCLSFDLLSWAFSECGGFVVGEETGDIYFHDYEMAVRLEVAFLDALRLSGEFHE